MPRATNNPASRHRRKKVLKLAEGYRGSHHRLYRTAKGAVDHAGQYAYRDRRAKKRMFRQLWIARINAGVRAHGLTYNRFVEGLRKANIGLDRKVLAHLAATDEVAFAAVVAQAKAALGIA
jgi:large subunit ribosomal protein L20